MDEQLRRLTWSCRRGIRELDLLLNAFLKRGYCNLSVTEQRIFEELLECPDPLLYDYFLERITPTDPQITNVIRQIRLSIKR